MNKYLYQNWRIFNKVKLAPINVDVPDNLDNINQWAEIVWKHLTEDEVNRLSYYKIKGKQGRTISVLTDDNYVYIFQVIRTEYNTNETTIMMAPLTESNINDFKAIAKAIHYNIKEIIGHSRKAVIELNKLAKAQEMEKEIADGNA